MKKSIVLSLAVLLVSQVFASEQGNVIQLPKVKTETQQNVLEFKNVPECENYSKEQEVASSYKDVSYVDSITSEHNTANGDIKTSVKTGTIWDGAKNQVSVCLDKAHGTIRVKLFTIKQEILRIESLDLGK